MNLALAFPALLLTGFNISFAALVRRARQQKNPFPSRLVMLLSSSLSAGIVAAFLFGNPATLRALGFTSVVLAVTLAQLNRMLHFRWWAPIRLTDQAVRWTAAGALALLLSTMTLIVVISRLGHAA